jgi:hypothetical protein
MSAPSALQRPVASEVEREARSTGHGRTTERHRRSGANGPNYC